MGAVEKKKKKKVPVSFQESNFDFSVVHPAV
jgi:hypothetical protein